MKGIKRISKYKFEVNFSKWNPDVRNGVNKEFFDLLGLSLEVNDPLNPMIGSEEFTESQIVAIRNIINDVIAFHELKKVLLK